MAKTSVKESPLNPSRFTPKRLVGVGKASFISIAAPFIDDNATAKKTAWLLAMFCMCISGSFALGYGYGGYVGGHFNWRYALWVEAILMLPFAILGFVMKPLQLKGFPPVESKEALTSVDTVASETEGLLGVSHSHHVTSNPTQEENMVKISVKDSALNPSRFTPKSPIKQISFQDQECRPKQKTAIQYSDDEDDGIHTRLAKIMKLPRVCYADGERYKLASAAFSEYKSELDQISLQERRRKQMELRHKQMELRRKQMPARQYSDDEDDGLHARLTQIMKFKPRKCYVDDDRYKHTLETFSKNKSELKQISLRSSLQERRRKQMELRRKQMPARQYSDDEDDGLHTRLIQIMKYDYNDDGVSGVTELLDGKMKLNFKG